MAYVFARDLEESIQTDAFFGQGFEAAMKKAAENGTELIVGRFHKSWKEDK